jgi:prepilin-type N-terminal cleavage/methylation domain-containing protein
VKVKEVLVNRQKGFSLVEMMVAMAIIVGLVAAGFTAMEYFNKQTKKEFKKLDDIQEFTQLTKDISKFVEGAGVSTAYLNMPIKKECDESTGRPCLRKIGPDPVSGGEGLLAASSGDYPAVLGGNACVQFYRDSFGKMTEKESFPGINNSIYKAKTKSFNDFRYEASEKELYATWELKDDSSAPFMLIKRRSTPVVFKLSGHGDLHTGQSGDSDYTFFYSDSPVQNMQDLIGYPFLVYSTLFLDQYLIKIADDVVSCGENLSKCLSEQKKMKKAGMEQTELASAGATPIDASKIYIIKFRSIPESDPFFQEVYQKLSIPSGCLSGWDSTRQSMNMFFFPTKAFSVVQNSGTSSILTYPVNETEIKVESLAHYYGDLSDPEKGLVSSRVLHGMMNALPIDIVRYKVKTEPTTNKKQLVSELFYALGNKEKVKINELKAPFYFARRLGTQELSLWYNPPKKQ